jgi:hypothetical protein
VELQGSILEASPTAEWLLNQSLTYEFEGVIPAVQETLPANGLCTIKARSGVVSSLGQVSMQNYVPIASLTDLECTIAAQQPSAPNQGDVVRTPIQFDTKTLYHILIYGYYPQIIQANLANVNGIDYQIMAVESDSQSQMTRLAARVWSL